MFIKWFLKIETNSEYKMKNEEQVWQLIENKKEDYIKFSDRIFERSVLAAWSVLVFHAR